MASLGFQFPRQGSKKVRELRQKFPKTFCLYPPRFGQKMSELRKKFLKFLVPTPPRLNQKMNELRKKVLKIRCSYILLNLKISCPGEGSLSILGFPPKFARSEPG